MKKALLVLLLPCLAIAMPVYLSAQATGRLGDAPHNPMLRLMHVAAPGSQQKASAARSWLVASFTGWSGASSGPYYTPQDSSTYTYLASRGGSPSQSRLGGKGGSFSIYTVPFDTMVLYSGWTDAAGRFTFTGLKRIRGYDAGNNMLTDMEQSWTSGSGVNSYRFVYTYNGSQTITSMQQNWQGGTWLDYSKDSFVYNTAGQCAARYNSSWYASPGIWKPGYRNYYFYDAGGNILLDSAEEWNGLLWKPYRLHQYTYLPSGQQQTHTLLIWSTANSNWKFYQDDIRTYDASNQLFSIVTRDSFKYATTGHYRNVDSIVNTSISSSGLPLITTVYDQHNTPGWVPGIQFTETYNSFGQITSEYGTHWENGAWTVSPGGFDNAFRYYYATDSVVSLTAESNSVLYYQLLLYPSPTKGTIYLQAANELYGYYDAVVLDASGKVCMQLGINLSAQPSAIDVSNLPAGQYWLQLHGAKGQMQRGFIKQ